MKKLLSLLFLALFAPYAGATTYHVAATNDGTSPNFNTFAAAVTAVNAGSGGDTISMDDSTTYTISATQNINQPNVSIVAASGQSPVFLFTVTGTAIGIQLNRPNCSIGSLSGGTIVFDGNMTARRMVLVANTDASWAATGANTTTFENLRVIKAGTASTSSNVFLFYLLTADATTQVPAGTVVNVRYVDFQFPAGKPSIAIAGGNAYTAIRFNATNGAVLNVENCQSNTVCGYVVTGSCEQSDYNTQWGTINVKNCRFVYDNPAMISYAQMGSPIATWSAHSTAHANGYRVTVDNSYLRSDANHNGIWSPTHIAGGMTAPDTSNSLGVITLLNNKQNNLVVTNSTLIGAGAGINVDCPVSSMTLTNSDIYVNQAAYVTPGYYVNISPRTAASAGSHNAVATRCNFYGLQGSRIAAGTRTGTYAMTSCNDWSPANAYATDWSKTTCVEPGRNPGYAGSDDVSVAMAAKDFTVSNSYIAGLNIGANRAFNFPVPVELSTFDLR